LAISIIVLRAGGFLDFSPIDSLVHAVGSDASAFINSGILSAMVIAGSNSVSIESWLAAVGHPVHTRLLSVLVRAAGLRIADEYPQVRSISHEQLISDWIYESPHIIALVETLTSELGLDLSEERVGSESSD
jgi:hypothetical protein